MTGKISVLKNSLAYPTGVAVDSNGYVYVSERILSRILRIDSQGTSKTVAGIIASYGYSGEGALATSVQFYYPAAVAVDSSGNLYVADLYNNRVRKVEAQGNVVTVAGNGSAVYAGDGGPSIMASLGGPAGVVVDGNGNLYISDMYNHRIRKVDAQGKISTVAGTGASGYSGDGGAATSAKLYSPWGLALDNKGNLYIADSANHRRFSGRHRHIWDADRF